MISKCRRILSPLTWSSKLIFGKCRSWFSTESAEEEQMRRGQIAALDSAVGAWKDNDHPELKQGAAKFVEKVRKQDEKRFEEVAAG